MRLEPWGVLTGRIVDAEGKPMAGLCIARWWQKEVHDLDEGYVPTYLFQMAPDGRYRRMNPYFPTDQDGRFRIEGLAPGIKYCPWVWDQDGELLGELIANVTVRSGETKDLGNLRLKPLGQPAVAKR